MKAVVRMQKTRFGVPPFVFEFTAEKRANRKNLLSLGQQFTVRSTPLNGFAGCSDPGNSAIILLVGEVRAANFAEI